MTDGDDAARLFRIATDSRARIPLAIVGVLLLLSTVVLLGSVETRDPVDPDVDPALAIDRTESATQTAVREAVQRAADRAATQPLTNASATPYGRVLDGDDPFRAYLKGLIYLETRDALGSAGQTIRDVNTTVDVPAVRDNESFARAIDRVTVSSGGDGVLTVEVRNVTTTAWHEGKQFDQSTGTITVSVATPVMQLHNRTERFQALLDAGITDRGFSQRFNARIYALGWARGYAQYGGMPITEVIANRHVKPSVNDAVYRTQKDAFGAADPRLPDAVRRGWLCMAIRDAEGLYAGYTESDGGLDVPGNFSADDACNALGLVFGDEATGELPSSPGVTDLLGEAPGMDAEQTIGVNESAYLPLREMASQSSTHSFESAIDRVFTVSVETNPEYDRDPFDNSVDCPHGTVDRWQTNDETSVGVPTFEPLGDPEQYYEYEATVSIRAEWGRECRSPDGGTHEKTSTGSFTVGVSGVIAEGEIAPDANATTVTGSDGVGVEHKYSTGPRPAELTDRETAPRPGSAVVPAPRGGFENYDADAITTAAIGGAERSALAAWIERHVADATRPAEVGVPASIEATVNTSASLDVPLQRALAEDVAWLQGTVAGITHTFERRDLLDSEDGPFGELLESVRRAKQRHLARDSPYVNVGQLAVYEARHSYFELLERELARLDAAHGSALGEIDSHLSEVDSSLDSALEFLQQGVAAEEPDPVPIQSPAVTDNVTYEVSGSPTYLVAANVTKADVPQVPEGTDFAPLAVRNDNHLKMPYRTVIDGFLNEILRHIPNLGDSDAEITFRMAGEALRAGELAETAAVDDEYGNVAVLERLTGDLREATGDSIDAFETRVRYDILAELYPEQVHCPDLPDRCLVRSGSAAENASGPIADEIGDALDSYDTLAQRAIGIGDGNATGPIIREVTTRLQGPEFRAGYAEAVGDDEWAAIVDSAVRPAVIRSASDATVTVDDVETVEQLDGEIRTTLKNATEDVLADRVAEYAGGEAFDLGEYEEWIDGVDTPIRVPAGLPLLPIPGKWFATVNAWDVEAHGEYARFEVTANVGTPETATATTYVRENDSVTVDVAGDPRVLGEVEPIAFSGRSILVVVVPPGGVGVGDRDDEDPECSATYPVAGAIGAGEVGC